MQILDSLAVGLRYLVLALPPVEIALTLGIIIFGLTWVRPRRIVSLPTSGRRMRTLFHVGVSGSLGIVAVATAATWLSYLHAFPDPTGFGGWWRRPAPLIATLLVIAVTAVSLRSEPLPAPGERAITPRRRWWAFAPRALLGVLLSAAALLLVTVAWQGLIGVPAPQDANLYGNVPASTDLPLFMVMQGGMGYVAGAGWPNHLLTLITLAAAAAALILTLGHDANRPIPARASAAQVNEERSSTARMLIWVGLGGLLLTLGAVWAHTGFIGQIIVGVVEDNGDRPFPERFVVGTGYQDIAAWMHKGGYVVQGIGAAILLRLAVDTVRARRALRGSTEAESSAPEALASTAGERP
ncbi:MULTISPECIES: hypothetical protein [unclassified Leucobacter]|uniref:hypothetical protein n=1 Tax=unclassified Leucobacter TaxID=2621730 RepID=UPI00165D818F|nr:MULTISPECIES: hypothetical protein [unclassified Leucobacter]MBC9935710.1 hypothetical protein [Leucobacter sp. cx-87]